MFEKVNRSNAGPFPAPREAHPSTGGDLYQTVTDQIIAAIKEGIQRGVAGMPCNHRTGRQYSGVNVLISLH